MFGHAHGCGGSDGGRSGGHIWTIGLLHDEKRIEGSNSITSIYRSLFLTSALAMIRNGRMQYDETKKNVCMLARKFPGRGVASSLYNFHILSELPQESESEQFISHKACPDYNCRKFGCMPGPLFQPCASGGRAQWQHHLRDANLRPNLVQGAVVHPRVSFFFLFHH